MGHKVNPITFRINISLDSKTQLKDDYLANIFIFRLIKNIIMRYSVPYRRPGVKRRPEFSKFSFLPESTRVFLDLDDIEEEYVEGKGALVKSPFVSKHFLFSHINISFSPDLFLSSFF